MDDDVRVAEVTVDVPPETFASVLAETTQSLVCVLDREGRILLFNDACEQATGFTRDDVLGKDARDFVIPPEEREAFGEVLAHVWKTGLPSPQVGHWVAKDGTRRLVAWSNRAMTDADGNVRYLVTSGLDITEREQVAEDVEALRGDLEAKLAEVGRLAQEQRGLRRVATLVAAEASPEEVFNAVSAESARVLNVGASAVFRFEGDDTATVVGRLDRDNHGAFPIGARVLADENSTIGRARDTLAPARIDDYTTLPGDNAATMQRIGYRSTVSAPIVVRGVPWGAVAVAGPDILPPEAEGRLASFCELVSLAVASAQARDDLRASRARVVHAGDEQRRKLERNLHDGAQQRLVSLAVALRLARSKLGEDPERAATLLEDASRELDGALEELRELARGLHPGVLTDRGLASAIEALTTRLGLVVDLDVPEERYDPNVEATAYFVVAEALTNIAKHADASYARVSIRVDGATLRCEIVDDGAGGADPASGTGILGLRDRVEAAGGSLVVVSSPGRGTVVTAGIPLKPR